MKERWIEPAAVQIDRIGPVAVDALARDEIVVEVAQRGARCAGGRRAAVALDVGVDQMKEAVGMRQARRPDAARVGIAAHVELTRAVERPCDEPPVDEIAGVVNLHAGEPLERGGRDVVVVADAHDRRIRVETAKNWIGNRALRHLATLRPRRYGAAAHAPVSTAGQRREDPALQGRRKTGRSRCA